jgi:hypothetical protein
VNRESEKGPKGDLPEPPAAGLSPRVCALSRERSSLRRSEAQVRPWHAFHCRSIAPKRPHTISSVRLLDGPAGRTSSLEGFEPNPHECRGRVRSRKRRPHVSVETQSPEWRKTRTKAGAPEPRRIDEDPLALSPMMLFARRVNHPLDVMVQGSHDPNAREHRRAGV